MPPARASCLPVPLRPCCACDLLPVRPTCAATPVLLPRSITPCSGHYRFLCPVPPPRTPVCLCSVADDDAAQRVPACRAVTDRPTEPVRRRRQPILGADPGRECAGSASDCALLCVGVPVSLQLLCCCVGVWVCVCCACVRRAACVYVCCVVLLLRWLVCMPVSLCWCACVGSPSCALHPT